MDAEVSNPSALSFPGIYQMVLEIMDILAILPLSFKTISPTLPFSNTVLVASSYNDVVT